MRKVKKLVNLLKSIKAQYGLEGEELLRAFKEVPKITATKLPDGFDDSNDIYPFLNCLTNEELLELGLEIHQMPRPQINPIVPDISLKPYCQIRVQAILCANDDGNGGASVSNAVDATYVKQLIDGTNTIYEKVGIQFVFDPMNDFEKINSTLLNEEFTIPLDIDLNVPETQSPFDTDTVLGGQHNWRFCEKCRGLFYSGHGVGECPDGGSHKPVGKNYSLIHDSAHDGQDNWRYCTKCKGLFYAGFNLGVCPSGGSHQSGQANYSLLYDKPYGGQDNWRFCKKCQGLFHAKSEGKCPDGGSHESGTANYRLLNQVENLGRPNLEERQRVAKQYRHQMLIFFSDGNMLGYDQVKKSWEIYKRNYDWSSPNAEFIVLGTNKWNNLKVHVNHLAHESGHYFHLSHPFRYMPQTLDDTKTLIKELNFRT